MAETVLPMNSALLVQWATDFQFYEARITILRRLRAARYLRRFHVGEQVVRASLNDTCDLVVKPDGFELLESNGPLDTEFAVEIASIVGQEINPAWRGGKVIGTFVEAVTGEYDEVLSRAIDNALGPSAKAVGVTDFALLVDGTAPINGMRYQLEWGIVDSKQAPDRVARMVIREDRSDHLRFNALPSRGLPPVALFADLQWWPQGEGRGAEDLAEWAQRSLVEVWSLSRATVTALHAVVAGTPNGNNSVGQHGGG